MAGRCPTLISCASSCTSVPCRGPLPGPSLDRSGGGRGGRQRRADTLAGGSTAGLRGLAETGPYGLVRHPLYLAYILADIGVNCAEWNGGTVLLTAGGWASLLYRIQGEERLLAQDAGWVAYVRAVRFRLLPGLW